MPIVQPEINQELQKLEQSSSWIELFSLDATNLGGSLYYFCNHLNKSGGVVVFGNQAYTPISVQVTGWDLKQTGTSAKPAVTLSNIKKELLSAVVAQGDLVGAKFTRIRTFAKYLADGETPNSAAFFGPEVMYIEKKLLHDRTQIQFQLTHITDRLGMKLPRRQILKDVNYLGCSFPGVSRNRVQ